MTSACAHTGTPGRGTAVTFTIIFIAARESVFTEPERPRGSLPPLQGHLDGVPLIPFF